MSATQTKPLVHTAPKQFWFVWTKNRRPPRRMHDTLTSAAAEASRLAEQNPGRSFIVLQAVRKFWTDAPEATEQ
jgi:hypothetical protein